ncbi:hypothetical protein ABZX77_17955 [Streptomyces sp. NPDC004237]|uniref:hypothetical protein n=1 Tax=Streptomyces sp. NPDC004237 TaxID=3154455 RepID=UPI0033A4EE4D
MTTMKTARAAFTQAARLTTALAALRDLYDVLPTFTVTSSAVLVHIPWNYGRADFRAALAGDIALLLGTELTVDGDLDPDDPAFFQRAIGTLDGVTVQVVLSYPPAVIETP